MASKKTIHDGLSFGSDLDDLSFDTFDLGESRNGGNDSKRRPITKIAFGAAKGVGKAVTSESTIRNVIAKALPPGYSATVEAAFGARDSASELYHSAADEWQKMAPDARRLVQKIVPHTAKILPKRVQAKLKSFAEGGTDSYTPENPDEAAIRRVLGELEGINAQERAQDRAEDTTREAIRSQMENKRHRQSQRMLASIDARLAQINAFNDQAFARYQKRSLEIQYRSYFVQRDLLKIQMGAAQDMRDAMKALVHNTALPDVDKLTTSDRIRQGVRRGARGAFDLGVNKFMQSYFGKAKERLQGHVRGVMQGMGSALSFGNMGAEQLQLMKEMGMDTSSTLSQEAGSGLMNMLLGHLASQVSGGFRRSGATAQKGAQAARFLGNIESHVANWAGKYDNTLLGQLLLNPLKDILGGRYRENRTIGKTAMTEAGEPGTFTKRTQRAIEEVMPDYLSRILHELQMSRQGSHAQRLVYNEDQNRMTPERERDADVMNNLFQSQNAKYGRESVNNYASYLLGGAKVSQKAYSALQREIALMVHNGDHLELGKLQKAGKFIDKNDARELRQAMNARFRGNLGRGQDKTLLAEADSRFRNLRSALPSPSQYMGAMHDMGHTQLLMNKGLVRREGDNFVYNEQPYIEQMYGMGVDQQREHSRVVSEDMGFSPNWEKKFKDDRRDLYKTPDGRGTPVIQASKIMSGEYTSMTTGRAIHYMHDLIGGVTLGGRVIATPEQVLKLYTANGTTYADWLKNTPEPEAGNGPLSRAQNWVNERMRGVGERADQLVDRLTGQARKRGLHTPSGRRAAAQAAQSQAADILNEGKKTVQSVVQQGMAHPQVQQAQAQVTRAGKSAKRQILRALVQLKRTWAHAVSAAQYGQALYERGGTTAVIDEAKLRGGEYYSAVTGKPITDLRDLVDGVKTKTQQWVAHPEEILNLETKKGYSFKTLMSDLQQRVDQVKETAQATWEKGGLNGVDEDLRAAHEATYGPVPEGMTRNLYGWKTMVSGGPGVHHPFWKLSSPEVSSQSAHTHSESPVDSMESLLKELQAFKEGNIEHLDAILHILSERDFTQVGGEIMGTAEGTGKKKPSLMDRMRKTRLGLVGRWGNAALRGAGHVGHGAARLYGKYVGGVFRMMGRAARLPMTLGHMVFGGDKNHRGKVAADVFVGNEREPRLTAGGMLAGDYVWIDATTGKVGGPVKCPKDIKGPVKSVDGTRTLISEEDLRSQPVTDRMGYSVARRTLRFMGRVASNLGSAWLQMFKLPFKAIGMAGRFLGGINSAFKRPNDVYVRGDDPWLPRVTAMGMIRGIYIVKTKTGSKTVKTPNDITGDVYDISGDAPKLVIGPEDFSKGLCNAKGKSMVPKAGLFARMGAGLLTGAATGIGGLFKLGGHMLKAGAALASMPYKFLRNLLTGEGMLNFSLFGGKKAGKTSDEQTHDLLSEILHMLDGRLPETEHYRRGSWQERMAERKKKKGQKSAAGAVKKAGSGLGGLWSKIKGLFSHQDEDEDKDDGSSTNIDFGGNDEKGHRGSRARNREAKRIKALRKKGFRGAELERELAKGGKLKRFLSKLPGGSRLGKIGRGLSGLVKEGSLLRKVGSVGGKLAGHLKGGLAGIVGGLGLDYLANKYKGSTVGKVAGGASDVLNVAGTAGTVVQGVSGISSLLGAGGAAAGAAETAAVGAGAAAEGGTLLALLSNPIGWGILGAAAVGAAAYGLYKFGSKIHSLKKREPFRRYRLAQYGFDIKDAIWKANDILKLEALLLPTVRFENGKAKLDKAGIKKVLPDIFSLFGMGNDGLGNKSWYNPTGWFHHTSVDDVTRKQHFMQWIGGRFTPLLLYWLNSLHAVSPQTGLPDIDDKLKGEEKFKLLKSVKAFPQETLKYTSSPFKDYPLVTGSSEQSLLDACYSECLKDCKTDDKDTKGKTVPAAAAKTAAGAVAAAASTTTAAKNKIKAQDEAAKLTSATKTVVASAAGKVAVNATANYQGAYAFLGGKISALEAVRYKTYGLKDFKPEQVKALFLLETDLLDKLSYDGTGKASYDGDATYWFDHYGNYFGIAGSDEKAKARWYSWFAKRFLPTLLQFATGVKKANRNVDPRDADNYLSPVELLGVANLIIASSYITGKQSTSVWTFTDSPYDDQPLNTDSKSVGPNLQVLKNDAAKVTMPAATATAPKPGQKPGEGKPTQEVKPGVTAQQTAQQASKQVNQAARLPAGMSPGSKAANQWLAGGGTSTPVGKPVPQPGGGTGGDINKIPVPSGTGYQALRGTLDAAAKMVGIDPTVLSTFAGIESSFKPDARAGTSSAAGLGQFLTATWREMMAKYAKKYGINPNTPPTDPRAAALMLGEYIKQNASYLKSVLGRDPTDTELYMAHFLGPGGAKELIQMPDQAIAAAQMPKPAHANQSIFYTRSGMGATKSQVVANLNRRVARFRDLVKQQGPASAAEMAANTTQPGSTTPSGIAPPNVSAGTQATRVASALTSGTTTPGGEDAVATSKSMAMAKATQVDRQARATAMASSSHSETLAKHAQTQTDLQRQMVQALNTIASHTSRTADGLSAMAKTSSVPDTAATAATSGTPTNPSVSTRTRAPAAPMPPLPVSNARTVYSDATV